MVLLLIAIVGTVLGGAFYLEESDVYPWVERLRGELEPLFQPPAAPDAGVPVNLGQDLRDLEEAARKAREAEEALRIRAELAAAAAAAVDAGPPPGAAPDAGSGTPGDPTAGDPQPPEPEPDKAVTELYRIVHSHQAELQRCFVRALAKTKGLSGRIDLRLDIAANGKTTGVEAYFLPSRDKTMEGCVKARALQWRFPQSAAPLQLDVPLLFGEGDDEEPTENAVE